jgi:hypothetical protein
VLGRLLTPDDDEPAGAHPVAVLSNDYWKRRFGRDPAVLGAKFRLEARYTKSSVSRKRVLSEQSQAW